MCANCQGRCPCSQSSADTDRLELDDYISAKIEIARAEISPMYQGLREDLGHLHNSREIAARAESHCPYLRVCGGLHLTLVPETRKFSGLGDHCPDSSLVLLSPILASTGSSLKAVFGSVGSRVEPTSPRVVDPDMDQDYHRRISSSLPHHPTIPSNLRFSSNIEGHQSSQAPPIIAAPVQTDDGLDEILEYLKHRLSKAQEVHTQPRESECPQPAHISYECRRRELLRRAQENSTRHESELSNPYFFATLRDQDSEAAYPGHEKNSHERLSNPHFFANLRNQDGEAERAHEPRNDSHEGQLSDPDFFANLRNQDSKTVHPGREINCLSNPQFFANLRNHSGETELAHESGNNSHERQLSNPHFFTNLRGQDGEVELTHPPANAPPSRESQCPEPHPLTCRGDPNHQFFASLRNQNGAAEPAREPRNVHPGRESQHPDTHPLTHRGDPNHLVRQLLRAYTRRNQDRAAGAIPTAPEPSHVRHASFERKRLVPLSTVSEQAPEPVYVCSPRTGLRVTDPTGNPIVRVAAEDYLRMHGDFSEEKNNKPESTAPKPTDVSIPTHGGNSVLKATPPELHQLNSFPFVPKHVHVPSYAELVAAEELESMNSRPFLRMRSVNTEEGGKDDESETSGGAYVPLEEQENMKDLEGWIDNSGRWEDRGHAPEEEGESVNRNWEWDFTDHDPETRDSEVDWEDVEDEKEDENDVKDEETRDDKIKFQSSVKKNDDEDFYEFLRR